MKRRLLGFLVVLMALYPLLAANVGGFVFHTRLAHANNVTTAQSSPGLNSPQSGDIMRLRTRTTRTYTDGGGFKTVVGGSSLNYQDGQGNWQPIDNTLVPSTDLTYAYQNRANRYTVRFPADLGNGPVQVVTSGGSVNFSLIGQKGSGAVSGSTDTFNVGAARIAYRVESDALKESISLTGLSAPSTMTERVHLSTGLSLHTNPAGGIDVVDGGNRTVFSFAAPSMVDKAGAISNAVAMTATPAGSDWTVAITADAAWLASSARSWPVIIDPTVLLQPTTQHCNLSSRYATASDCSDTYIIGGYNPTTHDGKHGLVQFALPAVIPSTAQVTSADLALTEPDTGCMSNKQVSVYQMTHSWTTSATWNTYDGTNSWPTSGGDYASTPVATLSVTYGGTYDVSLTTLVQSWINGTKPNDGVLFDATLDNLCPGPVSFVASLTSLTITWGTDLGLVPWHATIGRSLNDGMSAHVNVYNGNLVVSASDLSMNGVGLSLGIGHVFNNLSQASGSLGNHWNLSLGTAVFLTVYSDGSAQFCNQSGACFPFAKLPSGSGFSSPPGLHATLTANSGGTYTLTFNRSQTKYNFNASGYLTSIVDRSGNTLTLNYDGSNTVTSITDTLGRSTSFTYTGGVITQMTDPAGRTYQYGYTSGYLSSYTDPNGKITQYSYDSSHNLNQITDPKGNQTVIGYDGTGRVTSFKQVTNTGTGAGYTTMVAYNTGNTVVTDSNSHATTYAFDTVGRVTAVTDPLNHTSQQSWNNDNQIASETSPLNHVVSYGYDSLNNLTDETLPNGQFFQWNYANTSWPYQPSSSTDEEGRTTSYGYNSQGLQNSVTDPSSHISSTVYNSNGTVASTTDENGHTTAYSYFSSTNCSSGTIAGFPSRVDYPHLSGQASPLGSDTFTYDCTGRLSSQQDGKGQVTSYMYDPLDRTTGVSYNDSTAQLYQYDANGNQTQLDDYSPVTGHSYTTYTLNALNQETQKSLPTGHTIVSTFDGQDNLLTKTDGSGIVTYAYNTDDTLASVKDPQNLQTSFAYDNDGRQTGMTYPNGVTESSGYDSSDQLTQIAAAKGSTQLTSFSYSYTNPTTSHYTTSAYSVTDLAANVTKYGYDSLSRVTSAVQKTTGGSTLHTWSYGFDPAGNMTSINGSAATVNVADQLTGFGGHTYSYDLNGNQTSSTSGNGFTYNPQDQVTAITPHGGSATPMTYTGGGQSERTGNGTTGYQYDQNGLGSITASGTSGTYFTTTPDGQVLSERIPNGSPGCATGTYCAYYYLHDNLGSVIKVVDSTGSVQNSYSYDPYGNSLSVTGSVPNPFRYIGAVWDSSTGLYKMGTRYYDPSIGRFTQIDGATPCSLGQNPYSYVSGDPVNFVDPAGTSRHKPGHHGRHSKKHQQPKPRSQKKPKKEPPPFVDPYAHCDECIQSNSSKIQLASGAVQTVAFVASFFVPEFAAPVAEGAQLVGDLSEAEALIYCKKIGECP